MTVTPVVDEGLGNSAYVVDLGDGGTLTAGGTAPPHLLSPELTEPLARQAFRSIHDRLFSLPDDLPVFPIHGAGSFCSAAPGGERTTTIGRGKTANPLLADEADEDSFVARRLAGYGTYPRSYPEPRGVNRAGPAVLGAGGPTLPGALANAWRPALATWLGWLVYGDRDAVLVVDDTVDVAEFGSLSTAPDQVELVPTLVHCGHGERAISAASLLARAGHPDITALDGGPRDPASAGARLEVGV